MMNDESVSNNRASATFRQTLSHFAGYFISWIAYAALTGWLLFELREIAVVVAMRLRFDPWQVRALDNYTTFLLGLGWLAGVVAVEGYFRTGIAPGQLRRRIGKTFLALLIAVVTSVGVGLALA